VLDAQDMLLTAVLFAVCLSVRPPAYDVAASSPVKYAAVCGLPETCKGIC
jgi:hypothetical protein